MLKPIPRSFYPNLVTVLNLFFGFYAITLSFRDEYYLAFWAIVAGGLADAFDGKVARMVKGYSDFGVQYDSLADVVTFGVAPSILIYNILDKPTEGFLVAIAFFPLLFGSLRLARFNVQLDGFDKTDFNGLPSPASAYSITSIIPFNIYLTENKIIEKDIWILYPELIVVIVVLYSLLMVSKVKYETMPNFTLNSGKENLIKLIALVFLVSFLVIDFKLVIFPAMFLFSLQGIVKWILSKAKKSE